MPSARRLAIFFGGLAVLTAAVVFGVNLALKRFGPPLAPTPAATTLPLPSVDIGVEPPASKDSGAERPTFHIQPGAVDRRAVGYTAEGFQPQHITIRATDDIGCLITVVNQSGAGLRVGVNPHDQAGDPGADYGVIPPGETGILDVRYPGFEAIALHAHHNPAHSFSADYGQGCR